MKMCAFKQLCQEEQLELLFHSGVFIGNRNTSLYKIMLCQLEGFYVEIVYSIVSRNVEEIRSFEETDRLKPYLDRIDISGLVN
ncbi:MAG TPA: hypothetical protein VHK69_01175 [Chitinophagaceae bacterium]|nr:hypothetical protein [Chitinophagaceae bacterium]